jgi:hypothetical protein
MHPKKRRPRLTKKAFEGLDSALENATMAGKEGWLPSTWANFMAAGRWVFKMREQMNSAKPRQRKSTKPTRSQTAEPLVDTDPLRSSPARR